MRREMELDSPCCLVHGGGEREVGESVEMRGEIASALVHAGLWALERERDIYVLSTCVRALTWSVERRRTVAAREQE